MKKSALLLLALVLPLLLGSSRAEVLIYKGPGTVRSVPGILFPPKVQLYFLADIPAEQYATIIFFESNGEKIRLPGNAEAIKLTTAPIAGGGTARLFARGSVSPTSPPDFSFFLLYLRGSQKNLIVATGAVDTTANEPRTLTGFAVGVSETGGDGNFSEFRFRAVYQQGATVKANNAGLTLQQASDDLSAKLAAKGYELPQ